MKYGTEFIFEDLPPILQDEFAFALDDCQSMGDQEYWNRNAPRHVFYDDGVGYAASAATLLQGNKHTYYVRVDGEAFVWAYSVEQWCIVGEDL
jgi:hypothetical protein